MVIHSCKYCNYTSDRMYNLKVHVRNKHENNKNVMYSTGVPSSMYVGDNGGRAPTIITSEFGSGIRTNEPTLQCESGSAEVYNSSSSTVPIEDYNKSTECAHGWKNAYDNLYNQTGSGNSVEEVHKRGVEAIRNLGIALQKENEENKRLKKELHYEKLSKESLPIHMDEKILKKISILRGIKKGDNMGRYPNEMIHCICEAIYNIIHRTDLIAKGLMKYKLKHEILPIKNYLMEISEAKMNMKKKRKFLSKPQVGEGVLTAIASFVIPALISMITKK